MAIDPTAAGRLLGELDADLLPEGRLGLPKRYLDGDHDKPYAPKGAKVEFLQLRERAITNWMPRVPSAFTHGLICDGYRQAKASRNAEPWDWWQVNGLDARQTIATGGALEYGTAYVLVLPGKNGVPVIRPLSPLKTAAWYADEDAEFPEVLLYVRGKTKDGERLFNAYDDVHEIRFVERKDADGRTEFKEIGRSAHGMGVCPAVRFRERVDGESKGIIVPLKPVQDRLNEVVFATLIAMQYASFRQRWATGLAIPVDEETGEPMEPFQAAIDRLWVSDSPDAKFGDFAQTEISGHLNLYDTTVHTFAALAQINPNLLTGADLVNVSAEAMAQMEAQTERQRRAYEVIFGEAWEQVLRLAARAAGDARNAADTSAQVRWRDTEARSLKETVEALGAMATSLEVPVEALWEKIPGVTDTDITLWRALREEQPDPALALASVLRKDPASPTTATAAEETAALSEAA